MFDKFKWIVDLLSSLLVMIQQFWYLVVRDYTQDAQGNYVPRQEPKPSGNESFIGIVPALANIGSGFTWILNPASGDDDNSGQSPLFEDGETRISNGEFTRDITQRVSDLLQKAGIDYAYAHKEKDIAQIDEVVAYANDLADQADSNYFTKPPVMLTINSNQTGDGSEWRGSNGLEVCYFPGALHGLRFAAIFHENLVQSLEWRDRGLRTKKFAVLKNVQMPSVMLNIGFFDHKTQAQLLMDDSIRQVIAESIFNSIKTLEDYGEYGEGY